MQIDITDKTNQLQEEHYMLMNNVLDFTAKKEGLSPHIELSISIVTNNEIKELNRLYRHLDEPTDVLSFEMDHPMEDLMDEGIPVMMGDIVISMEKTNEQAERYNHSFERELSFLTVHGFLHLMGYTHDNKEEERVMFEKQEAILKEFRLERE
ncbi:MAG TPA: rRNA maturation RNase YbeY [Pseudogracilibacillus sp.]|nr:rRNA maturation RNase YbeY [Pseudogracilibacillus sp.]